MARHALLVPAEPAYPVLPRQRPKTWADRVGFSAHQKELVHLSA